MGINQLDPDPDPHFQFLCEHGARCAHISGSLVEFVLITYRFYVTRLLS